MFLTTELVFTMLMLALEKHRAIFIALVAIGLALFIAEFTDQPLSCLKEGKPIIPKYVSISKERLRIEGGLSALLSKLTAS